MSTTTKIAAVGLGGFIVGALLMAGVALAAGGGHDSDSSVGMMGVNDHYTGMISAMASMDYGQMQERMREILGDDAYARMLDHMDNHHQEMPMSSTISIDQMMHDMMDGMIGTMHQSASATATPTPR
jgi:hypothetical protein